MTKVNMDDPFEGITVCEAHPIHMDTDCEHCQAEYKAKVAISDILNLTAEKNAKYMAQDGFQMSAAEIFGVRLELLIESFLQDRQRLHFEVECARRIVQGQEEAKTHILRERLMGNGGGKVHDLSRIRKR